MLKPNGLSTGTTGDIPPDRPLTLTSSAHALKASMKCWLPAGRSRPCQGEGAGADRGCVPLAQASEAACQSAQPGRSSIVRDAERRSQFRPHRGAAKTTFPLKNWGRKLKSSVPGMDACRYFTHHQDNSMTVPRSALRRLVDLEWMPADTYPTIKTIRRPSPISYPAAYQRACIESAVAQGKL